MEFLPNHPGDSSALQSPMWDKNLLLLCIRENLLVFLVREM